MTPTIPTPLPACEMPKAEDITEEGFGAFRGTWFIGRVPVADAEAAVSYEAEILDWLDRCARDPEAFEHLASAIEKADPDLVPESLRIGDVHTGLEKFVLEPGDFDPLDGLEIGVAGLSLTLTAIGCLTAASCRAHSGPHSWSDAPVVLFAAPAWRLAILADLVSSEGCGVGEDRGMVTIHGPSIREMHRLAHRILDERGRFRRIPKPHRPPPRRSAPPSAELRLGDQD